MKLKAVCILFLLLITSSISFAETIVDTGEPAPNENGGIVLSTQVYRAGEFSIQKDTIITDIRGWMGNDQGTGYGPGYITISLYDDGGDAPGSEVYSEVLYIPPTDQNAWYGLTDLHWPLQSGDYWVSFEVRAGDGQTFNGYMQRNNIPDPLSNYSAYDNVPLSTTHGQWISDSTRFAVQIEGRDTVPVPASIIILLL